MLCTFSRSVSKFLCVPVCVCVCVCMCLCACACVLDARVHMCVCTYICMHMQHIASISLCKCATLTLNGKTKEPNTPDHN